MCAETLVELDDTLGGMTSASLAHLRALDSPSQHRGAGKLQIAGIAGLGLAAEIDGETRAEHEIRAVASVFAVDQNISMKVRTHKVELEFDI